MTSGAIPRVLWDVRVPMRDGVELSADIYLPPDGDGPWPAVLHRTPYDNTMPLLQDTAIYFARHGYAAVIQDVRGRCDSDGIWEPYVSEGPDGHDTIEWIAAQAWCTGKVGLEGGSYSGYIEWAAAREQPQHLTCMVSRAAAGRFMEELPYRFGVFMSSMLWWLNLVGGRTMQQQLGASLEAPDWAPIMTHRPLRDLDIALGRTNTAWRTWLKHNTFDEFWEQLSLIGHFQKIDVPVLHITGWFDGDQWGEMFYWHGMMGSSPAEDRQWLLCGPWDHYGTRTSPQQHGGRDFGAESMYDTLATHLRFFDRWLKGIDNGQEHDPKVRTFTMGTNEWREGDVWPPAGTVHTPFYLHSDGAANTLDGNGRLDTAAPAGDEPRDTLIYDPDQPTPSYQDLDQFPPRDGSLDKRWRLQRDDVLVYTSGPLEEDIEITGHPIVVLYAGSDCPDTDWHVALHDVHPDGCSEELTKGCMRAAYREGLRATPTAIEPGKVYAYCIELMATSNVWRAGHRLRISVASADYPNMARNPNTNAPTGDDDTRRVACNTICHTAEHPSHLLAPITPR